MFKSFIKYEAIGPRMVDPIAYLKFQHEHLFIAKNYSLYEVDSDGLKHKVDLPFPFRFSFLNGPFLYLQEYERRSNAVLYDIERESMITKTELKDFEFYGGNDRYLFAVNHKTVSSALFRTSDFGIEWERSGYHYFRDYNSRYLFSLDREEFSAFDSATGKLLWRFDNLANYKWTHFDEEREAAIGRLIGAYNSIVWIALDSGRLLGLDENTGELKFDIMTPNYHPVDYRTYIVTEGFGQMSQLDTQQGMLFGLENRFYWEIDLVYPDESFIVYDISETCSEHNIEVNPGGMGVEKQWSGNEIYFGNIDGRRNEIGVFDRDKKEVVWATKLNPEKELYPAVKKIIYTDDMLYVLDGEQTLHVLEREEK